MTFLFFILTDVNGVPDQLGVGEPRAERVGADVLLLKVVALNEERELKLKYFSLFLHYIQQRLLLETLHYRVGEAPR